MNLTIMNNLIKYVDVILPLPVKGSFTYTVPKGTYTASLPSTTLSAVRGQINALSQDDFAKPVESLFATATGELARKTDPEIFRENFFESSEKS